MKKIRRNKGYDLGLGMGYGFGNPSVGLPPGGGTPPSPGTGINLPIITASDLKVAVVVEDSLSREQKYGLFNNFKV